MLDRDGKVGRGGQVRHRYHRAEDPGHGRRRQDRGDRSGPGGDRVQPRRHHRHRQRQLPEGDGLHAGRDPGQAPQHVRRAGDARQRRLSRVLGRAQSRRIPGRRIQADRQGRQGSLDSGDLQPDPRRERQAVQGGEIRHRRHRAEAAVRRPRRSDRGDRQIAGGDRIRHGRHHSHRQRQLPRRAGLHAGRDQGPASLACSSIPRSATAPAYREFWAGAQSRPIPGGRIQAHRQGRQGGLDPGFLQPDPRSQRQAVQGGEVRHRHHHASDRPDEERAGPRHDGDGGGRRRGTERLGAGNLRGDDQVQGHRAIGGRQGRDRRQPGAAVDGGGAVDGRHCRSDRQHHRADQPAGAQRHH